MFRTHDQSISHDHHTSTTNKEDIRALTQPGTAEKQLKKATRKKDEKPRIKTTDGRKIDLAEYEGE
jgi:hypothetical protein